MNYCTHCRTPRMVGRFCGSCGEPYAAVPVLVEERDTYDDDEDDDEDEGDRDVVRTRSSSDTGGSLVIGAIVVGLILLALYGWSRPDIDESSPAYLQGGQVAAAYIDSGQAIDTYKTPDEVCDIKTEPDATEQDKTEAANNEAGCRAAFKAHQDAQN